MPQEIATFGAGCFWCVEAVFVELRGVAKVESGYAGGTVNNPTYEAVCTGRTGHAEAVQITFDPAVIGYRDLLEVFFATHDPTTLNRQGGDTGTQYRSAIFYHSPAQHEAAVQMIAELDAAGAFGSPIVTQVVPLTNYSSAEAYHQNYFADNPNQPYCNAVIPPKLAKLRAKFSAKLKA
jgi:peptide-methionine (S)-S-oxide reductase